MNPLDRATIGILEGRRHLFPRDALEWALFGRRTISNDSSDPAAGAAAETWPGDVVALRVAGRDVLLVGTAHVSRESADLVREVIARARPDHVSVELDERRYRALAEKARWEDLDLKEVIRKRQLATLMINLLLASFQKRIGGKLGVAPGTELLAAIDAAKDAGIPYSLDDRDIRTTMLRAWRSMSLWQKSKLLSAVAASAFGEVELTEDDLRELREQDVLSGLMDELAGHMPTLKRVLIDERDRYLAEKIRNAPGARVVAVVGAGHVRGIRTVLEGPAPREPLDVERVPPASPVWKWVGWSIPALIVGSLVLLAWTKGGAVAGHNLGIWILANGIPAAIGAVAALAHPGTILAAFVAAPITSLSPLIGAGYVTAFVQAYLRPPRVRDFHDVTEDAAHPSAWWRNRLLKVFLAFLLPSLGSVLGTFLGGYKILSNLF